MRFFKALACLNGALTFFFLRVHVSVVDGFPELLAQGRGAVDKNEGVAVAHLPWTLHLWLGCSHSGDRTSGEVDFPTDKENPCLRSRYFHFRRQETNADVA